LLAQKHEVIAIVIRDKKEEDLKTLGEVTLTSPQNSTRMETYFGKKSIQMYKEKLLENDDKRAEHFTQNGIRSVKIYTDEDVVSKLMTLFI
jgi:predicted component of type VI protein secretion system